MTTERKVKQVIVVRHDLQMNKGKFAVMVAHAACSAELDAWILKPGVWGDWSEEGFVKICLQARDLEQLISLYKAAQEKNLIAKLITDSGCTVFKEPTTVSLAIGPGDATLIDNITKDLKLW